MKLGDKVKIIKGKGKSNDIYAIVSIPFDVCGTTVAHIESLRTHEVRYAYDISFLEKVEDK